MSKPKPPEPDEPRDASGRRLEVGGPDDRVTVTIKVTDKMGDAFVSTEVGYSSSMLVRDKNDPLALYRRVAGVVNVMYGERRAEVRAALGRQTPKAPR